MDKILQTTLALLLLCAPATAGSVIQWRSDIKHTGYRNITLAKGRPTQAYKKVGLNKGIHSAAKSSPVVLEDGETFLQAGDTGILHRIDLVTSKPLWAAAQLGFSGFGYHSTPCAVYGDDNDKPDLAIIGSYDGVLSAFDLETGHRQWETTVGQHIGASPTCTTSFAYISVEFSNPEASGGVCKVDVHTGEHIWCEYGMKGHSHVTAGVDYEHNVVISGANDKHIYVFRETDGVMLAKYNVGGPVKGPMLMHKGYVIFGSWDHHIYAIDYSHLGVTSDASTIQIEQGPGNYKWPPIKAEDMLMTGIALDPETELLYSGGHDGGVRCFDFHTGKVKWEYSTDDYVLSSPVVLNNAVLIGSSDGHLYAFGKKTGKVIWKYVNGRTGKITSSPDISPDGRYIMFASDSYGFTEGNHCQGQSGSLHGIMINEDDDYYYGADDNNVISDEEYIGDATKQEL